MPAKLCSKSFKARLHQYMNQELPDAKASCFKEAEVTEIKLQTFFGPWRNQESLTKTSNPSLTKAFYCVNHKSCGKFLKWWQYNTTLPASRETFIWVKMQQNGHRTMNWFKIWNWICQDCILSPCLFYFFAEEGPHVKCWAEWITSWNQDCWEKYQQLQIIYMLSP